MTSPSNPSGANLYSQGGGTAPSAALNNAVKATRAPASTDINGGFGTYPIGQIWVDTATPATYILNAYTASAGVISATWNLLSAGSGDLDTLDGDSGSATPTAGAITIAGTASEISTSASASAVTISLPAAIVAPGSLTTTTTLTATLGAITATNGNLVLGTAGNKIVSTSVATTTTAGANSFGSVTLVAGTATVSTTSVTANSLIYIWRQSIGATGAAALGQLSVGTITAGTSFVINALQPADATAAQTTDVSVVGWMIVN